MKIDHIDHLPSLAESDFAICAAEPIHIPGSIQPHGVLLAATFDRLTITHASDNLFYWFGVPAAHALGMKLGDIVGVATADAARAAISRETLAAGSGLRGVLPLAGGALGSVLAHIVQDRVIVEIEPAAPEAEFESAIARAQSVIAGLHHTSSLAGLCERVVSEVRNLTGYDRVMMYRFDAEANGEVIAESRVPDVEPYLGLHYPASDIPAQARRLYLLQRVRSIPQIDYQPVKILSAPGLKDPVLDLSHAALRSVSPVHLEYMRNMGVGGTLGVSILQDQKLWGMIVCHHRQRLAPSAGLRALCDLIGQWMGLLISQVQEREALAAQVECQRRLSVISRGMEQAELVADGLLESAIMLMDLVGATGVFIRLGRRMLSAGKVPGGAYPQEILDTLRPSQAEAVTSVDALGKLYPKFAELAESAAGVLILPIANNAGDAIVWFRQEVRSTVAWGGDKLNKAKVDLNTGLVSPRKSFAAWRELVAGQSAPWREADLAAALELRRVVVRALLRHTEAELIRVSNADPLTGLANRRVLQQRMGQWLERDPPCSAAVLFCDLDRFKTVNDSLGHHAGDQLLHEVAGRLSRLIPAGDLLVRLGGDEFVIFCENTGEADALALAQTILRLFELPFTVEGRPYRASTSIGVAFTDGAAEDLLREADAAMYEAKRQGANCVVLFQNGLHKKVMNALRTEQDLFLAIERNELQVHFQPVIVLPAGGITGFEALARWHHPERGWVPPSEFIPLAEQTGLIVKIGQMVADQALAALAALKDTDLRVAINVSAHQLRHMVFASELAAMCRGHGVSPARITIEVTESILMQSDAVMEIQAIRALGCKVAIDDFGTGYSSLAYMQRLPVDIIKIDRSFVTPLGDDERAERFLQAVIELVGTVGLQVIAEGVETPAQRDILVAIGCRQAQGYLFGRPQPIGNFDLTEIPA